MPKAVQFDRYGDLDVLNVAEVERPQARPGRVLVRVVTAGTNPGEIAIREGQLDEQFPTDFPSGQGTDFAGEAAELGDGVGGPGVGTAVIGWSEERSAQAEFVSVPAEQVVPKPEALDWDVAGAFFTVATTATACVRAVDPQPGDTVLIAGASGGVGSLVSQLVSRTGASVVGVAGSSHQDYVRSLGATPISYEDDMRDALGRAAPDGIDAVIDTTGKGYVDLGIELGVEPGRINTIIDFPAASQHDGVRADGGYSIESPADVVSEVADLVAAGEVRIPIAATYDLDDVREAYARLEEGHSGGKVVLRVSAP